MPYLLLLPGFLFLFTFFILPIVNLAQTSTQTPIAGGDTGQYEQSLRFANYLNAFTENKEQFARSFIFALCATILALAIAYPLAYAIAKAKIVAHNAKIKERANCSLFSVKALR